MLRSKKIFSTLNNIKNKPRPSRKEGVRIATKNLNSRKNKQ